MIFEWLLSMGGNQVQAGLCSGWRQRSRKGSLPSLSSLPLSNRQVSPYPVCCLFHFISCFLHYHPCAIPFHVSCTLNLA